MTGLEGGEANAARAGPSKLLVVLGWLVLTASGLFALFLLFVGLTFGAALWDARDPKPTIMWLAVLAAPLLVAVALGRRGTSSLMLAFASGAACLIDAVWIVSAP